MAEKGQRHAAAITDIAPRDTVAMIDDRKGTVV
jgi:hypothetical protein